MIREIKPILRDETAVELNELLIPLLEKVQGQLDGIDDALSELTVDQEPIDLLNNFEDCCSYLQLKSMSNALFPVFIELRNALYSEYKEMPLTPKKKMQPYIRGGAAAREWVGKEVKPLILDGVKTLSDVSKILNINGPTINNRIQTGFSMNWSEYYSNVKKGVF